jgi:acyl carrier protein
MPFLDPWNRQEDRNVRYCVLQTAERQKAYNKVGGYSMDHKQEFLEIVAKYCDKDASEITEDMRFGEDLGFNSLSFMTFLGDLEDTLDVELEEDEALRITTIGEALEYMKTLLEEG